MNHALGFKDGSRDEFLDIMSNKLAHLGSKEDIDQEGKVKHAAEVLIRKNKSIFANISSPKMIASNGHAVVESLNELIDMLVASGVDIQYLEAPSSNKLAILKHYKETDSELPRDDNCMTKSTAASKLTAKLRNHVCEEAIEEGYIRADDAVDKTVYGYVSRWSDGFKRAGLKKKRKGVWVKTIDVPNPNGKSTDPQYTFLVALGMSLLDHTNVVNYILEQIVQLYKRNFATAV